MGKGDELCMQVLDKARFTPFPAKAHSAQPAPKLHGNWVAVQANKTATVPWAAHTPLSQQRASYKKSTHAKMLALHYQHGFRIDESYIAYKRRDGWQRGVGIGGFLWNRSHVKMG